ncbi:MAG: protease [Pseudobdellovibrionaceae bacterium]
MKKTMSLLAVLGLALSLTQTANAISLRFKFKTFSSGPNIYACNAGIRSQQTNKKVCYFEGTQTACTSDNCDSTAQNCNTRCICSSADGGEWLMNYGKSDYMNWKDNGSGPDTGVQTNKIFKSGDANWAQLFSDSDSWGKSIKNLSFNLGSELYGAQYFVDICYRGPQIEYYKDGVTASFTAYAQALATDFIANGENGGDNNRDGLVFPAPAGLKYTELSDLKVQAFMVCDLQGVGGIKNAANNSGVYNTTDNEATFSLSSGIPTGSTESGSFWSSSQKTFTTGAGDLISNLWFVNGTTTAPRFCKVRYVFTENNVNTALPNLRKWQRHGAEMCTYTRINEDSSEGGLD